MTNAGAPDGEEADKQPSDQRSSSSPGARRGASDLSPGQIVSNTFAGKASESRLAPGPGAARAASPVHAGGALAPGVKAPDGVSTGRPLTNTSPPSAAARTATARQIMDQVRLVARPGVRQLTLRLEPKELGTLRLRFELKGEQLRVRVTASTPEVVSALRNDLSSFASTLRESGIDLTSLDIELDQKSDGADSRTDSFRQRLQSAQDPVSEQNPGQTDRPADPQPVLHEGVIDVTA